MEKRPFGRFYDQKGAIRFELSFSFMAERLIGLLN